MDISDNINIILNKTGITKRELAKRVIALSPKLKRTGETPTESAIYNYLNGQRDIKPELISYFAEALDVSEIEILGINRTDRIKYLKRLIKSCTEEEKGILLTCLSNKNDDSRAIKIFKLLPFAPQHFQDEIIKSLEAFKHISEKFTEKIKIH